MEGLRALQWKIPGASCCIAGPPTPGSRLTKPFRSGPKLRFRPTSSRPAVTELLTPPDPDPQQPARASRLTRRQLLAAGLGGAAVIAGAGVGLDRLRHHGGDGLPPNGTAQRFVSAPGLRPTIVRYRAAPSAAPGLMFVGPDRSAPVQAGAMILD